MMRRYATATAARLSWQGTEEYFPLRAYPARGEPRHGGHRDGTGGRARPPKENDWYIRTSMLFSSTSLLWTVKLCPTPKKFHVEFVLKP